MKKQLNNASSKSMTKNTIYYVVYNIFNIAFPFVTGIYVARVLLPNNIGAVVYASNIAQYFVILSYLGVPTYGMREIAKARNDQRELNKVFTELYIIIFISSLVFLCAYLTMIFTVPRFHDNITLFLINGGSIALNTIYISWLYEGLEEFGFISLRNIAFKTLVFVFLILFVKRPEDYLLYAGILVLGTAGNSIINIIYAKKFVSLQFDNLEFKKHFKPVVTLLFVYLAIELYSLIDITMLGRMCQPESVTFYSYGQRIHRILLHIINSFTMVVVPRLSFYYKDSKHEEFNSLVVNTLKSIVLFAIPMIIGLFFTAREITSLLYGESYIVSGRVLIILSLTLIISPVGYLLGSRMLLITGRESLMPISVVCGAVVNIIGNAILIPIMAEYGASIASVISELVVMIISVLLGRRCFSLKGISKDIFKIIGAAIIMTGYLLICAFMPTTITIRLFAQIIGSIIIYCISLIILKETVALKYKNTIMKSILRKC